MIWYIYIYKRRNEKKKSLEIRRLKRHLPDFPVMFFLQPVYSNCLQRCEPCKPELARLANTKGNARCCCSYICIITIITISSIIFFFILSSPVLGPWRYLVFPLKLLSFFLLVWSVMHETKACLWSTRECRPLGMFDELAAFPWFEHVQTFQCLESDTRKTMKILYAAATSFLRTQTASRKFPCGGNLVRHQAVNSNKFKSRPSPDCNPAFTGSRTSAPNQLKLAVVEGQVSGIRTLLPDASREALSCQVISAWFLRKVA